MTDRMRDWAAKVPKFSWLLLLIAVVAGVWTHIENPYGALLVNPLDWCSANRYHAFAFGFAAVLAVCIAACALVAISGWIACACVKSGRFKDLLARALVPSIAGSLMLLLAVPVGIILGELLPLKTDPHCHQGSRQPATGM